MILNENGVSTQTKPEQYTIIPESCIYASIFTAAKIIVHLLSSISDLIYYMYFPVEHNALKGPVHHWLFCIFQHDEDKAVSTEIPHFAQLGLLLLNLWY